jgi:hypothetical protein
MIGKRTLVKLDVKEYSKLARDAELLGDVKSTLALNRKIRGFAEEALQRIGQNTGYIIESRPSSDSVLVHFKRSDEAHNFAVSVHKVTSLINTNRPKHLRIIFRIGCSTGIVDLEEYAGNTNTVAFRLEAGGEPGGILIDLATYTDLPQEFQAQYDAEEIIKDKLNEKFLARRWLGIPNPTQNYNNTSIVNCISDIPLISESLHYSFETITLDEKANLIRCRPKTASYLVELLEKQELKMIIIPAGEYGMGSSEHRADPNEKPQHQVKVSAFSMSQHPITKAQWKFIANWPIVNHNLKKTTYLKGAMDSPVVKVSWHDAVEFCNRLIPNIAILATDAYNILCRPKV